MTIINRLTGRVEVKVTIKLVPASSARIEHGAMPRGPRLEAPSGNLGDVVGKFGL